MGAGRLLSKKVKINRYMRERERERESMRERERARGRERCGRDRMGKGGA